MQEDIKQQIINRMIKLGLSDLIIESMEKFLPFTNLAMKKSLLEYSYNDFILWYDNSQFFNQTKK